MRLSNYFNQNRIHHRNYFLLLIICLLAYWPLTFGVFSVKNDAIHYFLPYRFNISEALRNGEMPFWSPYIYTGNPVMGDMQSGAWNPFVWLFSAIGRYDLTLFHFENLLYIFLGGIGMYKLTNRLVQHPHTALLIAVSYMLSGFMLGGQLINWLAAAAFLPFVIHYYLLLLRANRATPAIQTGIALFLLFTAGYPSFFILTAYLLSAMFIIEITRRVQKKERFATLLLNHLLLAFIAVGLSLPAIVSYIDLLPYYQRGAGTSYADAIVNAFDIKHTATLLFPSTIRARDMISATDLTCRNIYIGVIPIILLVCLPPKKSRGTILLASLAILALLFSLGDATPFRKICYQFVPLLDTFRHPSQVRLFFIFALLLLAAPSLKKILTNELSPAENKRLKLAGWMAAGMFLFTLLLSAFHSSLLQNINTGRHGGFRTILKDALESVTIADAIMVTSVLQLLFTAGLIIYYRKKSITLFTILWVGNLFIMAQLVLPASFVSKTAPSEVNRIIHLSPKGFPADSLRASLANNSSDAFDHFDIAGLSGFYNKKITISHITNSPAFLSQMDSLTQTNLLYNYVASKPVTYIADTVVAVHDTSMLASPYSCHPVIGNIQFNGEGCTNENKSVVMALNSNKWVIDCDMQQPGVLVLAQNYHHHWRVFINGVQGTINKANGSFMATVVPSGKQHVEFIFKPKPVLTALWLQLFVVLCLIARTIFSLYNRSRR